MSIPRNYFISIILFDKYKIYSNICKYFLTRKTEKSLFFIIRIYILEWCSRIDRLTGVGKKRGI